MKIVKLIKDDSQLNEKQKRHFAHDIAWGLSSTPKRIPSKYFYDDEGSRLFQQITQLEEYYLSRKEFEIINTCKEKLPDLIGREEIDIVELGVGDGHKTKLLIESFLSKNIKVHFYPVDISTEALNQLQSNMQNFNGLDIEAIAAEYLEGLRYVRKNSPRRQIVLFLGSNIGNFNRNEEREFLRTVRKEMHKNDFLLIGFDLKKDMEVLVPAYSDSEGVTADFNLNVLERINAELGGNFERENFRHLAQYNPLIGAMESFLISLKEHKVTLKYLERTFSFEAYEAIHMEYSFKFNENEIKELGRQGGFEQLVNFTDNQHYYIDSLWQAR